MGLTRLRATSLEIMTKQTTIYIDKKPFSINIPENLRLEAQRYLEKKGFVNFSELVRYALSVLIVKDKNGE